MPAKDGKNSPSRKLTEPLTSEIYKDEKPSPFSIEGIRSGAVQSKFFKILIVLSGAVMAGGIVMSGLNPTGVPQQPGGDPTPSRGPVATVGNQTITGVQLASTFDNQVRMNEQFGQPTDVAGYMSMRQRALQSLTDNAANIIAAEKAGIQVSEADIDAKIDEFMKDRLKPQQGQSAADFRRSIEQQYGSVDKLKEELIKNYDRDAVSKFLLVDKLEKKIKAEAKSSEDDYKRSVTKLKLWQIVVRPKFPAPGVKDVKAETDKNNAEAESKAKKLFDQLKAKPTLANFKEVAKKSSEDIATKAKGGDLGWKMPAEIFYGPDMAQALSSSKENLVGPLKDSSNGQYIFFIESRKLELPKDFNKDKKKKLEEYETQQDDAAWRKAQEAYKKEQEPSISDPALAAYQLQTVDVNEKQGEEQKTVRNEALERYDEALGNAGSQQAAAIHLQKSLIYRDLNDKAKQQEELAAAVKAYGNDAGLRLEYARTLREAKKTKEALAEVKAASTALDANPGQPSMFGGGNPSDAVRQQIASEYDQLKDPKAAAAERAKIKPAPGGGMGGMSPQIQMGQ